MPVHPVPRLPSSDCIVCATGERCRAYFHLLELFDSPHCHAASADAGAGRNATHGAISKSNFSVLARVASPPTSPFQLPSLPASFGFAQLYWFARYAHSGRPCLAGEAVEVCCAPGLHEVPFWYTTVAAHDHYIKVPPRQGFIVWCWRILWSTGGAGGAPEAANVTRRCEAIKAAADRNALAAEWQRSPFMLTRSQDRCGHIHECSANATLLS